MTVDGKVITKETGSPWMVPKEKSTGQDQNHGWRNSAATSLPDDWQTSTHACKSAPMPTPPEMPGFTVFERRFYRFLSHTEHIFFEGERILAMREMILADVIWPPQGFGETSAAAARRL
jgi:hypothetical protein